MPRVNYVKAARKDNPAVKRGEPYYWWKFRYGGKHFSKTRPRASQLTQSKMSAVYEAQEMIEDLTMPTAANFETKDELADALREIASQWEDAIQQVRDVGDEYRESAENMEEYFPNSERAEEIREKGDALDQDADEADSLKDEIESAADDIENLDNEEWQDEAQSIIDGLATSLDINEV